MNFETLKRRPFVSDNLTIYQAAAIYNLISFLSSLGVKVAMKDFKSSSGYLAASALLSALNTPKREIP
jgi:hypothetical protein